MPTYLFYPCQQDGSALTFKVHQCADDAQALAKAKNVLGAHSSAVDVTVWEEDRPVGQCGLHPV